MSHRALTTALLANLFRITALLHTGQAAAAVTVPPVVEEDIPLAVAEAIARKAATAVSRSNDLPQPLT